VLPQVGEAGRKGDTNSIASLFGPNDFLTPENKGVPLPHRPYNFKKNALHNKSRVLALSKPHWKCKLWGLLAVKPLGGRSEG